MSGFALDTQQSLGARGQPHCSSRQPMRHKRDSTFGLAPINTLCSCCFCYQVSNSGAFELNSES